MSLSPDFIADHLDACQRRLAALGPSMDDPAADHDSLSKRLNLIERTSVVIARFTSICKSINQAANPDPDAARKARAAMQAELDAIDAEADDDDDDDDPASSRRHASRASTLPPLPPRPPHAS